MNQTAVETALIQAERLLEHGDKEAIRQIIERLNELLRRGPSVDQGGPVGVDDDVLAAGLKIQMKKLREHSRLGRTIAEQISVSQRETFVRDVNGLCGGALTLEQQEYVALRFNSLLCYWLYSAAEFIQRDSTQEENEGEEEEEMALPSRA